MEEKITIGEQPAETCTVSVAAASEDKSNDVSDAGSPFGKFKDAASLLNGYQELEKEFTKKSQELSELKKSSEVDNAVAPIYKTEGWQEQVDEYLANNRYGAQFAKEIARTLMQDEKLASMPNCLDLAYNQVLASKYISKEDLVADEEYLNNYIYNNEKIKSAIISNYLKDLKNNSAPPIILQAGGAVGLNSPTKVKSLSEAKSIVERLFK